MSIVAVICGHVALAQIRRTGEQGRGIALAGLIIGYVGLAASAILVVIALSFLGWFSLPGSGGADGAEPGESGGYAMSVDRH